MRTPRAVTLGLLGLAALGLSGCAAVGLTLFGTAAGVGAGTGTSYALDSIVYRTFTEPEDELRRATLTTLKRMDIAVQADEVAPEGRVVRAQAGDREIEIVLERLTSRTTRMRVIAKQGWFFRDRATAGEIIAQTERTLEDRPAVSARPR